MNLIFVAWKIVSWRHPSWDSCWYWKKNSIWPEACLSSKLIRYRKHWKHYFNIQIIQNFMKHQWRRHLKFGNRIISINSITTKITRFCAYLIDELTHYPMLFDPTKTAILYLTTHISSGILFFFVWAFDVQIQDHLLLVMFIWFFCFCWLG